MTSNLDFLAFKLHSMSQTSLSFTKFCVIKAINVKYLILIKHMFLTILLQYEDFTFTLVQLIFTNLKVQWLLMPLAMLTDCTCKVN